MTSLLSSSTLLPPTNMADLTKDQKRDYLKFYDDKADPSFIARRNKNIVDEVIRETEANIKRKSNQYTDKLRERTDAVASYLKSVANGKDANIDKYFGRKYLTHLRGQQIIEKIKGKAKELSDVNN